MHKGALVAAQVAQWAIATDDLGHVPTTVEYCDYWMVTERSGWYHRANVRDALGDDWQLIVAQLAKHAGRGGLRSPRAVTKLAVPAA